MTVSVCKAFESPTIWTDSCRMAMPNVMVFLFIWAITGPMSYMAYTLSMTCVEVSHVHRLSRPNGY